MEHLTDPVQVLRECYRVLTPGGIIGVCSPDWGGFITMPLTMFYTEGICVDLSHKGLSELIEPADVERALSTAHLEIKRGDTVLLYTDQYRRAFGTVEWHNGPGISTDTAR